MSIFKPLLKPLLKPLAALSVAGVGVVASAVVTGHTVTTPTPKPLVVSVASPRTLIARPLASSSLAALSAALKANALGGSFARSAPGAVGPAIVVTAPARGNFTTQAATVVEGTV